MKFANVKKAIVGYVKVNDIMDNEPYVNCHRCGKPAIIGGCLYDDISACVTICTNKECKQHEQA